jgi:hypothetical protein
MRRLGLAGLPGEVVERIASYRTAGVERFYLQTLDIDDLEQLELVAAEVLPHF